MRRERFGRDMGTYLSIDLLIRNQSFEDTVEMDNLICSPKRASHWEEAAQGTVRIVFTSKGCSVAD